MLPIYTLGPSGSYSSKAANKISKKLGSPLEYKESITAVVNSTLQGFYGIIPMYNTYGGIVQESYINLSKNRTLIHTLMLVRLHINHCLVSGNGENIEDLQTVYSHPQALKQCEEYLSALNITGIPTSSTSEKLTELKFSEGAICSHDAATQFGLKILDNDISPTDNVTTFALISNDEYAQIFKKDISHMHGIKS